MDKYDVRELLGSGASGSVFRATRKTDGLSVAIKVIPDSQVVRVKDSSREVCALKRVVGLAGVPSLIEYFDCKRCHVIVMDLVVGTLMIKWLQREPSFTEIKKVYKNIASVLVNIERRGLYHNDLTVSNVILSDDGTATIVDFGWASWDGLDNPEWFEGTPEEIAGDSFGHLLAMALKIYYAPSELEYVIQPNVPKDLSDLALRCLRERITLTEIYDALSSAST